MLCLSRLHSGLTLSHTVLMFPCILQYSSSPCGQSALVMLTAFFPIFYPRNLRFSILAKYIKLFPLLPQQGVSIFKVTELLGCLQTASAVKVFTTAPASKPWPSKFISQMFATQMLVSWIFCIQKVELSTCLPRYSGTRTTFCWIKPPVYLTQFCLCWLLVIIQSFRWSFPALSRDPVIKLGTFCI